MKTKLDSKDNGKEITDTGLVFRYGLMVQNTRVTGRITKLMDKEPSGMCMVTNTMENGREIKLMVLENTLIATVQLMKVIGRMIFNMEKVQSFGMII